MAVTATLLAVFAILFVIGFVVLNRSQEETFRQSAVNRQARLAANGLIQASIDAETGQRGYLLTGDPVFLAPYQRGKLEAARQRDRLRDVASVDAELANELRQTEAASNKAFADIDHTLALQAAHTLSRAQLRDELLRSKVSMDDARVRAGNLLAHVERIIDGTRARNAAGRFGMFVLGGLLGALTLLAVALSFWALRLERRGWRAAIAALEDAKLAAELARAKAAASDLAKTRFLAVASHDMRQPLHALTLYLSALARRVDTPEAQDIVVKMDRAASSLVGMFASLLDLARIQADVITPEFEDIHLQDIIERLVVEQPGAHVSGPSSPTPLVVRSDLVLLERVLRNLVSNAIRHGGGAATITVTPLAGRARISVSDRGRGIATEDQARIFDEFTRLDSRGGEGLGLGLAIVKRISEILDLQLEVKSAPGEGATFSIHVPTVSAAVKGASDVAEPRLDNACIVVLDDDPLALEAVAGVLRDAGSAVRTFGDEHAMLCAFDDGLRPDLLVLDLRVRGELHGVDIGKSSRATLSPPPPVIIITGDTAADTLAFLSESGFTWLIKPVDRAALIRAAAEQMQKVLV